MTFRPVSSCKEIESPEDFIGCRVEWTDDRNGIEPARIRGRVVECDPNDVAQVIVLDAAGSCYSTPWRALLVEAD